MTNSQNSELDELREALQKDFRKLYVKEFTTDWSNQRLVRGIEVQLMTLKNIIAWSDKRARAMCEEVIGKNIPQYNNNTAKAQFYRGQQLLIDEQRAKLATLAKENKDD